MTGRTIVVGGGVVGLAAAWSLTRRGERPAVFDRPGRIVLGAGFSGQGFRFAPGVGAVLAGLALAADAQAHPVSRLR